MKHSSLLLKKTEQLNTLQMIRQMHRHNRITVIRLLLTNLAGRDMTFSLYNFPQCRLAHS